MRLSCQEQLLPGDSLEEKWAFATGAGFEGIELRARATATSPPGCPSCGRPPGPGW